MKILQIFKDFFPPVNGGIERHINLLSIGLRNRGIDSEILVSNTSFQLVRSKIDGVPVTKVPQLGRLASAPINPTFPLWLRRLGENADILHFHLPNPTADLSYLFSGLNNKVVVTYHSDIVRQKILFQFYYPFLLKFLSGVQLIISTSKQYLYSSKILKRFLSKCIVIPLGTDINVFAPSNSASKEIELLRQRYGTPIIIFVGRFRYYKGLHLLIEAMKKIPAKLLLIGAGPLERKLHSQVTKLNLTQKIFFLGELDDFQMINYLRACDLLILPSHLRAEAFGVVQLEAMACEKPVISTELGTGTSFLNKHQITGLVIPPNDLDALVHASTYLIENRSVREKFGKAGREMVKKHFNNHIMVEKIIKVYHYLLNGRSA